MTLDITSRTWRAVARRARRLRQDDRGQATTEYGLVILVAGAIALGVIAWAGTSGEFTNLFEGVLERLTSDL
jgi:Flp pilus assembly pilin Flp